MDVEDYLRLMQRHRWLIVVLVLVGLVGGAAAAASRPKKYQSIASVVITSTASSNTDVGTAYNVAQTIRVTMPTYLALSTSTPVTTAAAEGSGIPVDDLAAGLKASNPPDTMVIAWTLVGTDPGTTTKALDAVSSAFIDQVRAGSPRNNGQAVIRADVAVAAQPATPAGLLTPPLGAFGGALAGLLIGVIIGILRAHSDHRVNGRKDVERVLGLPVVAEIEQSSPDWRTGWTYLASFVTRLAEPVTQVVLVGGNASAPSDSDADELASALRGQLLVDNDDTMPDDDYRVAVRKMGRLTQDRSVAAVSNADTLVVLVLQVRVDDLHRLLPSTENLKRATTAQLCVVLVEGSAGRRTLKRLVPQRLPWIRRDVTSAANTSP